MNRVYQQATTVRISKWLLLFNWLLYTLWIIYTQFTICDGFSTHSQFHAACGNSAFSRINVQKSTEFTTRIAKVLALQRAPVVIVDVVFWLEWGSTHGATRWSEQANARGLVVSFRLDVRCERDCRAVAASGCRSGQTNEFPLTSHTSTHTHAHICMHTLSRYVSGCCLCGVRSVSFYRVRFFAHAVARSLSLAGARNQIVAILKFAWFAV